MSYKDKKGHIYPNDEVRVFFQHKTFLDILTGLNIALFFIAGLYRFIINWILGIYSFFIYTGIIFIFIKSRILSTGSLRRRYFLNLLFFIWNFLWATYAYLMVFKIISIMDVHRKRYSIF